MSNLLAALSLVIGLAALIRCTLERQAAGRLPIVDLIHERFGRPGLNAVLAGLALGFAVIAGPLGMALALGWAQLRFAQGLVGDFWLLAALTLFLKLAWAAAEELIFRGAVLPQTARCTPGLVALAVSAILFAWGHLERGGAQTPDGGSLLVFGLDGLGFALAYLGTRRLWLPTLWHAGKNSALWLLLGQSTLQLTQGLFQASYTGPAVWLGTANQAGWLDVAAAALAVGLVAVVYWRRLASSLAWLKTQ